MKFKIKKPLSLLAGLLAIVSVAIYILENRFTFLVLMINSVALGLFIYDNRKHK